LPQPQPAQPGMENVPIPPPSLDAKAAPANAAAPQAPLPPPQPVQK